jgi:hypothetical protein
MTTFGWDLIRRFRAIGVTFTRTGDGSLKVKGYTTPNQAELIQLNWPRSGGAADRSASREVPPNATSIAQPRRAARATLGPNR